MENELKIKNFYIHCFEYRSFMTGVIVECIKKLMRIISVFINRNY